MDLRSPLPPDFELILASQSPRRHSLLRDVGLPFKVVLSEAEEELEGGTPQSLAEGNALAKLQGATLPADVKSGAFVLATDTIVVVEDRVLGKASSEEDAVSMLALLSGRTHQVISGVALARVSNKETGPGSPRAGGAGAPGEARFRDARVSSASTDVTFVDLEKAEIESYIASGEWKGKAGAYAIQGLAALFCRGIRGEYSNVVGLPLGLVAHMFREFGFDLVRRSWL
ncbi:MAG: Maf family protein [Actinobacteria bacterium]|nr:Maf family protein [Actinomycetota bacterium]